MIKGMPIKNCNSKFQKTVNSLGINETCLFDKETARLIGCYLASKRVKRGRKYTTKRVIIVNPDDPADSKFMVIIKRVL